VLLLESLLPLEPGLVDPSLDDPADRLVVDGNGVVDLVGAAEPAPPAVARSGVVI